MTVLDKVELKNQFNINTFAASEQGLFLVTTGCDPLTGVCDTGYLHHLGFNLGTSKITARWSASYENSSYVKPGLRSIRSGASPTLFQGMDGANLVAIVDNAYPQMNVLVLNRDNGTIIEKVPVFSKMRGPNEASLIGVNGHIAVVENNFDHAIHGAHLQYAPKEASIAMIKIKPEGGHEIVWENSLYPSSVFTMSMLARESGIIFAYTGEWNVAESSMIYNVMAIDSWNGRVIWRVPIGQERTEYGGIYFNRTSTGTGIYIGTERYLVSIQDYGTFSRL